MKLEFQRRIQKQCLLCINNQKEEENYNMILQIELNTSESF